LQPAMHGVGEWAMAWVGILGVRAVPRSGRAHRPRQRLVADADIIILDLRSRGCREGIRPTHRDAHMGGMRGSESPSRGKPREGSE
jgi:hypothetical protein